MSAPMLRVTLPLPLTPLASNKSRNCRSNPPPRDAVKPPKKTSPRSQVSTWVKSPFISEDSQLIFSWSFRQFPQKLGGKLVIRVQGWCFFCRIYPRYPKIHLVRNPQQREQLYMIYKQPYSERSASVLRVRVPWISLGFFPTEKFWIPESFRANTRKVLGGGRF